MTNASIRKSVLSCADPQSEKGKWTFEWRLPNDQQITTYYRDAGTVAGGHYHTGSDPSKDPELFLLIFGRVKVRAYDTDQNQSIHLLDATNGPVELIIPPFVLHFFEALTRVIYIEYRVTRFNKNAPDVHSVEEWQEMFPKSS